MEFAKEDINELKEEFSNLSYDLFNINQKIAEITRILGYFEKQLKSTETSNQNSKNSSNSNTSNIMPFRALKPLDLSISTRNGGVPTDRQTDQQTDRHIQNKFQQMPNLNFNNYKIPSENTKNEPFQHIQHTPYQIQSIPTHNLNQQTDQHITPTQILFPTHPADTPTDRQTNTHTNFQHKTPNNVVYNNDNVVSKHINDVIDILNSLDSIKKDLRIKFKRLTEQEFLVFSTMYQLDEEIGHSTYKTLSEKLNLTESSIRDYIGKIIKKGIPVEKIKINNKMIQLNISQNLKKLATLSTLLQLREI